MRTYEPRGFNDLEEARMYAEAQARNPMNFRDPGGNSALRAGKRIYPCPTCGRKNQLTAQDKKLGYQCDRCANAQEGNLMGEW